MKSARLLQLRDELMSVREHRARIRQVPTPQIVQLFHKRHQRTKRVQSIQQSTTQCAALTKSGSQLEQQIHKAQKAYQQRLEFLKDKIYILKAFMKNLEVQYQEAKKEFAEVEFLKTLAAALRRCYLYKLAEIFLNDQSKYMFQQCVQNQARFNSESRFSYQQGTTSQNEDHIAVGLAYMAFIVQNIAKILNITILNPLNFRGIRSYIRSVDKADLLPLFFSKNNQRKPFQQALRVVEGNIVQILDIIGVDRKVKKQNDLFCLFDILTQYIIVTEVQELKLPN